MIKAPTTLQDLRRKIYIKAKSDKAWRFWGIYVHVCKLETLREAYKLAKQNNGSPGVDGITFEDIKSKGIEEFLEEIHKDLVSRTYYPTRNRKVEIAKPGGKTRVLQIPTIRDRVVQGALKLILEPIFEADFQPGSHGYRPKKSPKEAVEKVSIAIVQRKYRVIDVDIKSYFDTVLHYELLKKVAKRVNDPDIMMLLKRILKGGGKRGIQQGGPLSPLLSNIYLTTVDEMLEKAKAVTKVTVKDKEYTALEYYRWADDLVILVKDDRKWDWLYDAVYKRLQEELNKLGVTLNTEKTKLVNLGKEETFTFLGFVFRRVKTRQGKWGVLKTPKTENRTKLLRKLKEIFQRYKSQPTGRLIKEIKPILRGWVQYFRIGNSSRCFGYIKDWVEKKVRRHLMRARNKPGWGWRKWSKDKLYKTYGLYNEYKILKVYPSL